MLPIFPQMFRSPEVVEPVLFHCTWVTGFEQSTKAELIPCAIQQRLPVPEHRRYADLYHWWGWRIHHYVSPPILPPSEDGWRNTGGHFGHEARSTDPGVTPLPKKNSPLCHIGGSILHRLCSCFVRVEGKGESHPRNKILALLKSIAKLSLTWMGVEFHPRSVIYFWSGAKKREINFSCECVTLEEHLDWGPFHTRGAGNSAGKKTSG